MDDLWFWLFDLSTKLEVQKERQNRIRGRSSPNRYLNLPPRRGITVCSTQARVADIHGRQTDSDVRRRVPVHGGNKSISSPSVPPADGIGRRQVDGCARAGLGVGVRFAGPRSTDICALLPGLHSTKSSELGDRV